LKRVVSRNHKIQLSVSNDGKEVEVALDGSEDLLTAPTKDFILLLRDDNINKPTAFSVYDEKRKEQAIIVNLLPDMKPDKLKARFLNLVPQNIID